MSLVQYLDEFMCVPLREGGDETRRWAGEIGRLRKSDRALLSMCWRVSHAEPIASRPSVEISKEVITTDPAQFLTVDARLPP